MNCQLALESIAECAESKGIDVNTYATILKDSIFSIIKEKYGEEASNDFSISIDLKNKSIHIEQYKKIVKDTEKNIPFNEIKLSDALKIESDFKVGEFCTVKYDLSDFTKADINRLRQIIISNVNKTKSLNFYNKYNELKDNHGLVNAYVYQVLYNSIMLKDNDNNVLILPFKESINGDRRVKRRQYMKVVVSRVDFREFSTTVTVSRISPYLLRGLLEFEIPEISDKFIEIIKIVRIAGVRSKVIVDTDRPEIDPVSTCVGVHGTNVEKISNELRGEYVDFVKYSDNLGEYLARLFCVPRVRMIHELENSIFVYIDPEYLGLAIGKEGINIRLVRMLFDKHIDVFKYSNVLESDDVSPVEKLEEHIEDWIISDIKECGFDTLESILNVTKDDFEKKTDFEKEIIDKIYELSESIVGKK